MVRGKKGADVPERAVVVDGDPVQLRLLAGLLREVGLEPCAFADVEAALSELDPAFPPRLIVTSLRMLESDGWRFCHLLRSQEYSGFNSVPIVVTSATSEDEESKRIAANLGVEALLPSPMDEIHFIDTVRSVLAGDVLRQAPLVLLVADAPSELQAAIHAFDASGWQIETACSTEDAHRAIARFAFAAAVIGPGLSADRANALFLDLQNAQPDCACVIATSDPDPKLELHWLKRGAAACVRMPYEPEYLVEVCERVRPKRALLRTQDLLEARTRELRDSEANLRESQEIASLSRWEFNLTTGRLTWSDGIFDLFELDPASFEPSYEAFLNFVHPDDRTRVDDAYRRSLVTKEPYDIEHRLTMPDGRTKWVREICRTEYDAAHRPLRSVGVAQDITRRKQTELALADHEHFLQAVVQTTQDGFFIADAELRFLDVNDAYCRMTGYSRDELLEMRIHDIEANESSAQVAAHSRRIFLNKSDTFETRHRRKHGGTVPVEITTTHEHVDGGRFVCFCRDVTKWQIEQRILEFANQDDDLPAFMHNVTEELRHWLQIEAVGIRLKQGDDYPYYETQGFSPEFVCAESALCQRTQQGALILDATGNPVLDCMCGNVIRGRFDPALPFFTEHGSFWTNSTSDLLAQTSEEDRQARTRNRCHGEGFESVALIPLRVGETCLGLLQLNDRRRDRFTKSMLILLERLVGNMAIAIAQRQATKALRDNERFLVDVFEGIQDGICVLDMDFNLTMTNQRLEQIFGNGAPLVDRKCYEAFHHRDAECEQCAAREALALGRPVTAVIPRQHRDGEGVWLEITAFPLRDAAGTATGVVEYVRDITERRQVEEDLFLKSRALDQISDYVTITDLAGVIRYVNEAETKLMGASKENLVGATIETYGEDPGHGPSQREILAQTLEHGEWRGDVVNFDGKGDRRVMHCRTQVVHDESGAAIALCGIATDVTDLKAESERRDRQLVFSEAMNRISAAIIENDRPEAILEAANRVIGEALQADRLLIYKVSFPDERITALSE